MISSILWALLVPLALLIALALATLSPRAVAIVLSLFFKLVAKQVAALHYVKIAELRVWRRKPIVSGVDIQVALEGQHRILRVEVASVELTGIYKVVRNLLLRRTPSSTFRFEVLVHAARATLVQDHSHQQPHKPRFNTGSDQTAAAALPAEAIGKLTQVLSQLSSMFRFVRFRVTDALFSDLNSHTRCTVTRFDLEGNFDGESLDLIAAVDSATSNTSHGSVSVQSLELKAFVRTSPLRFKWINISTKSVDIVMQLQAPTQASTTGRTNHGWGAIRRRRGSVFDALQHYSPDNHSSGLSEDSSATRRPPVFVSREVLQQLAALLPRTVGVFVRHFFVQVQLVNTAHVVEFETEVDCKLELESFVQVAQDSTPRIPIDAQLECTVLRPSIKLLPRANLKLEGCPEVSFAAVHLHARVSGIETISLDDMAMHCRIVCQQLSVRTTPIVWDFLERLFLPGEQVGTHGTNSPPQSLVAGSISLFFPRVSADLQLQVVSIVSVGQAINEDIISVDIGSITCKCANMIVSLKVDDALVAVNMERGNEHIAFHMPGLAAKGWIMEKTWVLNVGPAVTHLSLRFVALVVNRILQPAARIAALATAANAVGSRHDVEDTELGADELEGARWVIEVRLASATQPVAHDAAGSHEGSRAARSRVKKRLPQIFLDGDEHFVVLLQLGLESVAGVSIASAGAAITIPQRRRSVQAEGNIVSTRIFMLEQQGAVIELPSISVKVLYSSLGLETVLPTDSLDRWLTHSPSASQTFTDNSMNPKNAVTELPLLIDVAIPSILFRLDYATDFGVSVQNIVRFSKATEVLLASFLSYHEDGTTLPPQQGSTSPSVPAHDIAAVCVEVSIEHIEFECADEEDTASERRNLGTFVAHSIDVQFCISLSKEQLYEQMRSLDNATVTPPIADFKSIFGGNLMSLSVGTFHFLLADIPIPFVAIDNLTAQGSVILSELKVVPRFEYKCPVRVAENVYSGAAPTMIDIALPIPSLKFFHDIDVTIERGMVMLSGQQEHILAKHFGPRMERVAPPRADPSAKLPPWDVVRFLFHGFVGARANSFNLLMVPGYPHNLAGLNVSVEDVTFRNRQRQPLEISAHNVAATCIHLKEQYGSATKSRGYFMESDTTKLYQSVGVFLKIPCVQFAAKFDWLSRGDRHNHYVHLQRVDAASATLAHQLVQKEHSSVLPTSPVQPRPEPTRDLWNPPCQGDTFFWFRSLRANVRFAIHLLASDGKALGEQVEPSCYVNQERSAHLHTIVRLLRDNVEPAELRDKVKFSQLWRNMQLEIQTSSFVLLWWENLHSIDHVQFGMSDFDCTIELANDLHYPLMEAKRLPQSSLQNMNLKTSEIQVGHGFSIPESPDFDHTKDKSVFLYASALSILIDRRDLSQRVDEEQNDSTSSENKNSFVCEDFRGLWNMRNRDLGFSFGTSMFQFGVGFSPMSAEMVSPNEVEEIAPDIAQDDPLPLQREVTLTPMEKILLQDETSTSPTTTASVASVWMESFRIHFQNVTLHFVAEEWDSAVSVYAHNACATKYVRTSENTTKLSATNTSGTPLPEKWEFQLSKVDAVNAATDIQIQTKLSRQSPHFYPSLIHRVIKNFEIRVDFVTNLDGGQSSSIAVFIPRLHVDATSYDFTTFVSVIQYVLIVKPSATSDDSVHDVEKQSPRMFSTIFNLSNPDITSNGEHAALCACRWDRYVVYDPVLNSVPAWSERGVSLNNRNGWPSLMTALDDCATIDINAAVVLPQHGVEDISFNPNQPDVSINWFCGPYCIETPLSDQSYTDDVAPVVSDSAKARAVRLSAHKRWKRLPAEFLEGVDAAVCCRMWPPYVDVGGSRDCLVVYLFRKHWYVAYDCRADQVIGGVMSIRDGFPSSKSSYVPVELPAVHAAFSLNDKVFLVYGREYVCPQESRHPRRLRSRFAFASDHLFSENAGLKQPHDLPGKMTLAVEACLKETSTFRPGGGRKSIDYNICVESIQLQLLDQAQQIFGTLDLTKTTVNAKLFDDGSMNLDSRICTVRIHESAAVAEVRRAASKADAASTQVDDEPTNNTGPRKYALTWTFLGPTNVAPDDSLLDREMISVQARTIALQSTRWANDKSVSLVQFFEIDLFPGMHSSQHPESTPILDLNMTRSLYKKVWAYFFPTKSRRNAVSAGSDPLMLDSAPQSASAIKSPKSGDKHPAAGVASGPKGSQTRFGRRNTEGSAIHSAYFNPVQQHKVANGRSDKLKFFYFKTAKIGAIRVILSAHGFPIKVDRWKLKLDSFRLTSSLMTSDDVADSLKHSYVKILMKAAGKLAFGKLNNRKVTKHPNQLLSRTMILDTSESKKAPPRSRQWKCVLGGFLRIGPNQSKHPSRETHSIRPGDLFTELERVDERSRFRGRLWLKLLTSAGNIGWSATHNKLGIPKLTNYKK